MRELKRRHNLGVRIAGWMLIGAIGLVPGACGRKGPLEPPGTPEGPVDPAVVFGASPVQKPPKPPPPTDEDFFLDPFI